MHGFSIHRKIITMGSLPAARRPCGHSCMLRDTCPQLPQHGSPRLAALHQGADGNPVAA